LVAEVLTSQDRITRRVSVRRTVIELKLYSIVVYIRNTSLLLQDVPPPTKMHAFRRMQSRWQIC